MTKTNNGTEKKVYVSNRPNISMKDLKKMFQYMTEGELERDMQHNEWIKLDKFLEQESKKNEAYREKAERKDVASLSISVEWHKSRTWGNCPTARYTCHFADGSYTSGSESCSGCGYDKESTVIARIFNNCCSGMLWRKTRRKSNRESKPYGVSMGWFPYFDGGVGTNCYVTITQWLGGKWERTASGRTYDNYYITFKVKSEK